MQLHQSMQWQADQPAGEHHVSFRGQSGHDAVCDAVCDLTSVFPGCRSVWIDAFDEEHIDTVKPLIPQLLDSVFSLMQQVSSPCCLCTTAMTSIINEDAEVVPSPCL